MSMPSRAHAARLGLRGFGGVDLSDAAERAAALRWAATLRRISRTLGSVVRSAASAHALAKRRYLEQVSMSMVETRTCGDRCLILAHPMPWFGHTVQNCAK